MPWAYVFLPRLPARGLPDFGVFRTFAADFPLYIHDMMEYNVFYKAPVFFPLRRLSVCLAFT